ncbi:MAG: hypothetical protein ACFFDN_26035 [Candidatus Hodarchaeota archaeon]
MAFQNSYTYKLLNLIGSPFVKDSQEIKIDNPIPIYDFAKINRIRLLGLDRLLRQQVNPFLEQEYRKLQERNKGVLRVLTQVSELFSKNEINFVFFKTLRPYEEFTVDLDILIFGDDFNLAVKTLIDTGCIILEEGPLATTLLDKNIPLNLDLHDEIGISHIVYLDKNKLHNYVKLRELDNNILVPTFDSKTDLLTLIAHSIIKEHLYTLSEYFTTLGLLNDMNDSDLCSFVELAENCHIRYAASTHLSITAFLHQYAYGFVPVKLKKLIESLVPLSKESLNLLKSDYSMPHRYSTIVIGKSILDLFKEPRTRKSLTVQIKHMSNPHFNSKFFKALFHHMSRKSY